MSTTEVPTRDALERELEHHRAALTGYCYRMLGSPFEAEDAVQETLLRAWRALDRFEGRAALRSWLFGIATNVCLDLLNAGRRRALPMDLASPSPGDIPIGPALPEYPWIGPIADTRALPSTEDPAEMAVARETIRLAFVAALQHLQPRQRAVLLLRDVFRWKASEVAEFLGATTMSVHSLLRRARAALAAAEPNHADPAPLDGATREVVDRYAQAFEQFDVDTIVAMLHEEVTFSMPPHLLWMRGADAVRQFLLSSRPECRRHRVISLEANGGPALASYQPTGPGGRYEAFAIQVIEVSGGRILGIHGFLDPELFPLFRIPSTLDL